MIRRIKLLISIPVAVWDWQVRLARKLFRQPGPGTCVILYYHHIDAKDRANFARQMDDVIRFTRPLSITEYDKLSPGRHHAIITFDDGFRSVFDNATPILQDRKIPYTVFIPTGFLGDNPNWINSSEYRNKTGGVISPEELRELNQDDKLLQIGSHSVSHPQMPDISPEKAHEELKKSKETLENILKEDVTFFSFPHGEHNEELLKLARSVGYEKVFTVEPTLLYKTNQYAYGRVNVEPYDSKWEFRLKLLGAYRWMPLASLLKRKLIGKSRKALAGLLLYQGGSETFFMVPGPEVTGWFSLIFPFF